MDYGISFLCAFFVVIEFIYFLTTGKSRLSEFLPILETWCIIIAPFLFLFMSLAGPPPDCCTDMVFLAPGHRIGIYCLIVISVIAYVYSRKRTKLAPPLLELMTNCFLMIGIFLNIILFHQISGSQMGGAYALIGCSPIILLFIMQLCKNQRKLRLHILEQEINVDNKMGKISKFVLLLPPFYKYPLIIALTFPILIFLSLFLLIFGQKPDSIILAFTETYHQGFSRLDYLCENIECGGHFLCSVGANGHPAIVKPIRYGERRGRKIVCTRQLLIANAFEEILQEKMPSAHLFIRKQYDFLGKFIHKYYYIFSNKYLSDTVYILMKPLEIIFLGVLYSIDSKPENRIAKQYIKCDNSVIA